MQLSGVKPNSITFMSILSTYLHFSLSQHGEKVMNILLRMELPICIIVYPTTFIRRHLFCTLGFFKKMKYGSQYNAIPTLQIAYQVSFFKSVQETHRRDLVVTIKISFYNFRQCFYHKRFDYDIFLKSLQETHNRYLVVTIKLYFYNFRKCFYHRRFNYVSFHIVREKCNIQK